MVARMSFLSLIFICSSKRERLTATMSSPSQSIIQPSEFKHLAENGFVVVEDFLANDLYESLREDVQDLRQVGKFQVAKIGHDGMVQDENTPFRDIRYSETCFIGRLADGQLPQSSSKARSQLYNVLDQLKTELETNAVVKEGLLTKNVPALDKETDELMYAYYPQGGYYRRHRDAEAGSVSNWRKYSLLLYLNDKDWKQQDGGQLRIHRDSGDDELPAGELPNFIDVQPKAGTLVLFRSDQCPHEVIDTRRERMAIVGWFLSQEPNQPEDDAVAVSDSTTSAISTTNINADTLQALRALRNANPRLKARLEPPPPPSNNPPSALSIWGDDFILPGAVANPVRSPATENVFPDTDTRYWKKIATFDTAGNVNTLSLSSIRLQQVADVVPLLVKHAVTLDLANTSLPVADLATILSCVDSENGSLRSLRLGGNSLSNDDIKTMLSESPSFLSTVSSLDLRYNDIGPEGAEVLANWLVQRENSCCKVLYLEGTKLGDKGAEAIAKVTTLEEVYLGSNGIGPEGATALAPTAVSSWRKLYLEGNLIGSTGATVFVEALETASANSTKTLERLYADNNGLSKEVNLALGNAVGSATLIGEGGVFQ